MDNKRVFYVCDQNLLTECNRLPVVLNRASLVHSLIQSHGLFNYMTIVSSKPANYDDLREFHSEIYLDHLKKMQGVDENYETNKDDEELGIGYDCAPVSNLYNLVSVLAGGSIIAAKALIGGFADIAINWCGGWHHAQRFEAEGFCYVNDIVIAIEKLIRKFQRVLYVDLDVHHGNGVEDAYNISKNVLTLSFHKYEPGFYPGSGNISDIGSLSGKGYACNFPLREGYSNKTLLYAFDSVFPLLMDSFGPSVIVVQCGADALAGDPIGGANLTQDAMCYCVSKIVQVNKPVLLLGGGGYVAPNAARLWTHITALVAGVHLDSDIPEHDFWPRYGPDYQMDISPSLLSDKNDKTYLDTCIATITDNIRQYVNNKTNS